MLKCFLGAGLWLLALASVAGDDIYGVWSGVVTEGPMTGRQHSRYEVVITLAPGSYRFEYPALQCGGALQLLSRDDGRLRFRDQMEYGEEKCSAGGYTVLRLDTQRGAFQWYDANGILRVEGVLKRSRQIMI